MRKLIALGAAISLTACATTPPTPAQCAQKRAELASLQNSLPALEGALTGALAAAGADPNSKAVKDAQAALAVANALIAADAAYLSGVCSTP